MHKSLYQLETEYFVNYLNGMLRIFQFQLLDKDDRGNFLRSYIIIVGTFCKLVYGMRLGSQS